MAAFDTDILGSEPTKRMMMNGPVETLFDKTSSKLVGKPVARVDGSLKVSGQAPYSAEFYKDNRLFGVLVGATISNGKVTNIDTESVADIPGVIKVVTDAKHFLRNSQQGGKMKAPTQGAIDIAYHGQPIAIVVGETFEAATEGAKALVVSYEDETDEAALDFKQQLKNAHEVNEKEGSDKNSKQGDPEKGLQQSAVTLDRVYTTPNQSNSPMEPHSSLAYWEDDKLIIYTSNQMVAFSQKQIADALEIDNDNVNVISRYVGGGFGSKLGISPESIAAAIAAKELDRPVLVMMTRPQVMEATVRRSNTRQRIALGCDENGVLNTIIHDSISSNLPNESFFEPAGLSTHYLYRGENRRVSYQQVDMNWTLSGSMRAPGEAVGQIALECAMDELACQLGIDPIELRRRNEPEEDPSQQIPFSTRQLLACLEQGSKAFGWEEKHSSEPASRLEGDWWIGTGMAVASRGNQLMPSEARATLQLDPTKTLGVKAVIESDMTDIGTGSYTVFSQVAADLLGLPIDHIDMQLGDSRFPSSPGSGGSFGAASAGSSIYLACAELREQIAKRVGLHADTIQLGEGQVSKTGEHQAGVAELAVEAGKKVLDALVDKVEDATEKVGLSVSMKGSDNIDPEQYDFSDSATYPLVDIISQLENQKLSAKGQIAPGKNGKSHRQACYGANFAEVAVHRVTGEIRVKNMTGAFTAGRILNHNLATSQCYGGMVFGIGAALMEEVIHDKRDGRLCNHDLAEYHLPVNADVPQLEVILVEEDDPYTNPMHIKGIGETAISGAAAAIANAIYNAVGVRVYDFPITLDKLIDQLPD
ncbi:xanthine dehydrogenase family protein molybdopterin-binding subunit [Psychrobacter sp. UBA3962]|uniref:xanthine dehydrogenase family protein molybdopterin-binding subunit n=1 Tax=Psychrobacter sp. UBA3962 TaxID=1947352 RepID=UPI0025F0907C|nr:xanthine dehydrogenase family protein molybdopterin-binding subunit [Psychrobacter sp. UBA3962]